MVLPKREIINRNPSKNKLEIPTLENENIIISLGHYIYKINMNKLVYVCIE